MNFYQLLEMISHDSTSTLGEILSNLGLYQRQELFNYILQDFIHCIEQHSEYYLDTPNEENINNNLNLIRTYINTGSVQHIEHTAEWYNELIDGIGEYAVNNPLTVACLQVISAILSWGNDQQLDTIEEVLEKDEIAIRDVARSYGLASYSWGGNDGAIYHHKLDEYTRLARSLTLRINRTKERELLDQIIRQFLETRSRIDLMALFDYFEDKNKLYQLTTWIVNLFDIYNTQHMNSNQLIDVITHPNNINKLVFALSRSLPNGELFYL